MAYDGIPCSWTVELIHARFTSHPLQTRDGTMDQDRRYLVGPTVLHNETREACVAQRLAMPKYPEEFVQPRELTIPPHRPPSWKVRESLYKSIQRLEVSIPAQDVKRLSVIQKEHCQEDKAWLGQETEIQSHSPSAAQSTNSNAILSACLPWHVFLIAVDHFL